MRQILVAIDDREASERVSEFVNRFFGGLDVAVTAVNIGTAPLAWGHYAAPPGLVYAWPYMLAMPPVRATTEAEPDPSPVERVGEETIASSGVQANEHIVEVGGDVAEALRRVAEDHHADLLVVGSSHKGLLERMLSPSVSTELAKSAPLPVLVVH